jgi:hypothetical protein
MTETVGSGVLHPIYPPPPNTTLSPAVFLLQSLMKTSIFSAYFSYFIPGRSAGGYWHNPACHVRFFSSLMTAGCIVNVLSFNNIYHRCCYVTVDSAMVASQNGFCSYKLSYHKKTNIMQIMTKYYIFINIIFYLGGIEKLDYFTTLSFSYANTVL